MRRGRMASGCRARSIARSREAGVAAARSGPARRRQRSRRVHRAAHRPGRDSGTRDGDRRTGRRRLGARRACGSDVAGDRYAADDRRLDCLDGRAARRGVRRPVQNVGRRHVDARRRSARRHTRRTSLSSLPAVVARRRSSSSATARTAIAPPSTTGQQRPGSSRRRRHWPRPSRGSAGGARAAGTAGPPHALQPLYVRRPDAELERERRTEPA